MSQAETHASILSLPQLVNGDAGLVRRGRYLTTTFLVEAGDTEFLVQVAAEAVPGLDRDRLLADLQDERYRDEVERDRRIAERLGVRGTPSLFVNGKFVADWSYEGLKAAIDEALAGTGGSGRAAR